MTEQAVPLLSTESLKREFKLYLPLWFLYLEAVGLLHLALANFPDAGFAALGLSRFWFAVTFVFPLTIIVLFLVLRLYRSKRLAPDWKSWGGLAAVLFGVPAAVILFHQPRELNHDQLTWLFEISQFVWVALLVTHLVWSRGWHSLVLFFGVTFAYGLILENTGIFMHFFFEPSFRLYLWPLPAPLCTMLGWCVVFYVTVALVQQLAEWVPWLKKTVWRRATAATLAALLMDAQLDPLASMSGVFWQWNELLPPVFLGVPIINFAAWFGAFLPYTYLVFKILDKEEWSPGRKNWELFIRLPLAALIGGCICFGIMAIVEAAFDGPTFTILREFSERLHPYG